MARQRPARTAPALPAPPRPAARGARLWLFRLLSATALPVLLLASLEGALRFAGLGEDTGFTIPCSVQGRPARCDNPDFSRQFFPPGMARQPTPFAFPDEKGPRTFRIFVLGESAAQGDPEPAFGFGRFLEVMLRARFPSVRFEVVNSGVPAISSHVVLQVARDLAGRGGDLFLVYAGNNEVVGPFGNGTVLTQRLPSLGLVRASIFVRGLRLGQLLGRALRLGRPGPPPRQWGGMAMFLEQQVRESDPSLITVGENFRGNLRDAVAAARGAGAQVIVSTVGTRLRGCAPFSSLHAHSRMLHGWPSAWA